MHHDVQLCTHGRCSRKQLTHPTCQGLQVLPQIFRTGTSRNASLDMIWFTVAAEYAAHIMLKEMPTTADPPARYVQPEGSKPRIACPILGPKYHTCRHTFNVRLLSRTVNLELTVTESGAVQPAALQSHMCIQHIHAVAFHHMHSGRLHDRCKPGRRHKMSRNIE